MNLSSLSSGCTISMGPAANNRHPCKECGDIFNDEKSLELHKCIHKISRDLGHLTTSRTAPIAPSSFSSTASSSSSSSSSLFVNNVASTVAANTTFSRIPMTTNESMCAEVLANIIDLHVRNKTQNQQGGNYGSSPQQVNSAQSDSNDGVSTATVLSASFFKCSSCDKTFSSQGCLDTHVKTHQNPKLRCEEVLADILQTKMKGKESVIASLGATKTPHNICKYVFYGSTLSDKSILDVHSGMHRHHLFNKKSPPAKQELKCTLCDDEFDDITNLKMYSKNHNHLDSASKTLSTKKKKLFSNETQMVPAKKDTFLLSNKNVFQLGNKGENKPRSERSLGAGDTTDQTKPELKRTSSKTAFAVSIGLNTSSKRKKYKCTSCKEAFEELASLKNHSTSHHSSLPPNDSSSPPQSSFVSTQPTCPPSAKFKCTFCNKDFLNLIALETHTKSHPEPQSSFKCSYCNNTFTNFEMFSKHLRHVKKGRSDNAAKMVRLLDKCKTGGKQNIENCISKPCVSKVGTGLTRTVTEVEEDEDEEEGSSKKRARKTGGYITKKKTMEDDDLNTGLTKIQTTIAATVDTSSSTTSVIDSTPCAHGNNATTKDIKNNSNSNQNPNANSNFTPRVKFVTPRSLFKCTYCNKEFPKLGKLKRHVRIHTGEKPYKCPNCQKCFTQSGNLTHHLRTHNGDKPYACNTCSKSFSQSSSLTIHKRSHTGERPFACSYCDKRFSHSGPLNHHIRTHTGEKPFKCQFCDKAFPQSSQLRQHVRTHTGEKPYKCTLCLKNFTQSSSLNIHLRSHTGERPFKCQHCEKSFAQSGKLHQHAKIHMAEKTVNCPWPSCTKEVLSSKLTSHLWTHLEGAADKKQPLKCDICDRVFKQVSSLSQHLQLHTGEKRYECKKCEKVFSQANKLNLHRKAAHAGERPYKCWFCVKTFPQPADLTLHERTHTGEKPYTCDICQRGFSQTGSLSRHRRIHTGEKPFECKMCEKAFSQSSGLAQHMKTHTQEKPYSCKYCCKAFSFSSKLKEHLTIHTNEKPFRCKVCSKQFRSSSNLSNHKKHCSEADNSSRQTEDPPTCDRAKEKSSPASKIELSQTAPINQSEGISQIETVTTSVPAGNIGIDSVAERNKDTEVTTSSSDFQPQTQSLVERTLEEDMELESSLSCFADSELAHIYTFTVRVIGNKNDTVTSAPITEPSLDDPSHAPVKNDTNINTIVTSNGPHLPPEETLSTDLATTTTSSQVDIFVSHNEEVSDSGGIQLSLPQSPSENIDGLALLEQEVTCFPKSQASTANIDAGPILDNCAAYVLQAALPTVNGRDPVACSEESGSKTILQTTVPSSSVVADIQADSISNLNLAVSVLEPKSSATGECYQSNHVCSSSDENVLEMQAFMPNSCKEPTGSNYDPQKLLQGTVEQQRIGSNSSIYSASPVVLENSVSLRSIRLIEDGHNFSSVHHVAHLYEMSYSVTPQELGENQTIDTTCNLTNTTTIDKNNSHNDNIIARSICSSNNNNNDNNNNKSLHLVPCSIPRVASETTVENNVNSSSACKDFPRVSITEEGAVTGSHDVITTNVVSTLADLS